MANNPELKITNVRISEHRTGIPLKGWDNVHDALRTFQTGKTRSARVTQRNLKDNIARDYSEAGLELIYAASDRMNAGRDMVDEMLHDAEVAVKGERGRWSRDFDYDAMGTCFFKSTVDITRVPNEEDVYLLGLNAAYVGREVEDGLAKTLGIEQGLQWKVVVAELEPVGAKFRVNFDEVVDRIKPLYETLDPVPAPKPRYYWSILNKATEAAEQGEKTNLSGEKIVRTMLATDEYTFGANPFVLGLKNGIEISLSLGQVGDRFSLNRNTGKKEQELWEVDGAVLTGPLAESYREKGKLLPPSLVFSMERYTGEKYVTPVPVIDPEVILMIDNFAERIADAFRPAVK